MISYLTGNFIKYLSFRTKRKLFAITKVIFKNLLSINNLFTTKKLENKKCLKHKLKVENMII